MTVKLKLNASPADYRSFFDALAKSGIKIKTGDISGNGIIVLSDNASSELLSQLNAVENICVQNTETSGNCEKTEICIGDALLGNGKFSVIAGPCTVESEEQILSVAKSVKASGAKILRGGAFKPRTSPYSFQGLGREGLRLLSVAKAESGLPVATEIMSEDDLIYYDDVDVLQIGARNMQNFKLLRAVSETDKPVILKRGFANTLRELLMSAEYIMSGGNERVILCERGIRTFSNHLRNTFDVSSIPELHGMTHLPVIADPSHAAGKATAVPPLALAAVAAGADGIMIEVHNCPENALCDGGQALTPDEFDALYRKMSQIRQAIFQ